MNPTHQPTNVAASVRARLLELSRHRGVEFQLVLAEFAVERLLYRLGVSSHGEGFVLKGAMLFKLWSDIRSRATWDLDLMGRRPGSIADVVAVIQDLCAIHADDGITFVTESVAGEEIRATDEYAGVRVRLEARLADARIPVQVDVGMGDSIVPAPRRQQYPTLLDHVAPLILAYPRETVVAEKCEAMVALGVTNSRMKDFYDVHLLASTYAFDGPMLADAIRATFQRRQTSLPESVPLVLARGFLSAPDHAAQWRAFVRRGRLVATPDVDQLTEALRTFLAPVLQAVARGDEFTHSWPPGGPWQRQT